MLQCRSGPSRPSALSTSLGIGLFLSSSRVSTSVRLSASRRGAISNLLWVVGGGARAPPPRPSACVTVTFFPLSFFLPYVGSSGGGGGGREIPLNRTSLCTHAVREKDLRAAANPAHSLTRRSRTCLPPSTFFMNGIRVTSFMLAMYVLIGTAAPPPPPPPIERKRNCPSFFSICSLGRIERSSRRRRRGTVDEAEVRK